ncbi:MULTISPECIES: hypothetical protein [unclassified Desulfovibrio]|uniref:hypothetical protein n=1 Tax=unclassified Desulfovibrio TaxID=2593640 RepID=UPI0013EA31A4|nr:MULTISPECIES: hypothetical protein [unclassified Desulfovibrio]
MPCPAPEAAAGGAAAGAFWPEWLEGARVDDSVAGAAYEATPPRFRAALKSGLALAHFHFGESLSRREESACNGRLGFRRAALWEPAPWALIVFSPAYAAAARLTAACVAARLAGVAQVGAVCLGGEPVAPAVVSLELSGVEDMFQLERDRFAALMDELAGRCETRAPGRVVLLHAGELDEVAQAVRARNIPCFEECRPPRLRIEADAGIDRAILAFAQGGPAALDAALAAAGTADVVYRAAAASATPSPEAPLTLCPGCEGFWLYPGLGPEFFTVSRRVFAFWAPSAAESPAS